MTDLYGAELDQKAGSVPQAQPDFGSVYTENLPHLLKHLGVSVAITTYQAGKLILMREDQGELNTHFRIFDKPMGIALQRGRLSVGARNRIHEFHNVPAVSEKVSQNKHHDAVYVPRRDHVTGDVDVHEMVFDDQGELWFVNTRFSCLSTVDLFHSFTPRWRPPFISNLAPEDRCHLNGLGIRDGKPRYVTMLGATDSKLGWHENKQSGGLLMDINSNRVIAQGLSFPHSPRWYNNQLWILESGKGSLCKVDEETGAVETVATMPGFTRGMDIHNGFAFIGLSQLRESVSFSGLPLTEHNEKLVCGVWVVELSTGKTVAFLQFEGAVQEVFAIQVLANTRYPELLESHDPLVSQTYVLPNDSLKELDSGASKVTAQSNTRTQTAPEDMLPTGY